MSHPVVVRKKLDNGAEQQFDLYSRLNEDRIIFLDTDFHDGMASIICAQLMVLSNQDPEQDITMYINSPGGSVTAGLAIYDTINLIPNDVKTVVIGNACSMGAFMLSAGTKGKRYATPSARVMIHMVSGGAQGTTADVKIRLEEQQRLNDYLNKCLANHCGKTVKQIEKATERDYWMDAQQAKEFGIIDGVL